MNEPNILRANGLKTLIGWLDKELPPPRPMQPEIDTMINFGDEDLYKLEGNQRSNISERKLSEDVLAKVNYVEEVEAIRNKVGDDESEGIEYFI